MANPKKQTHEVNDKPLDVTLLDFYAAPIAAALAQSEWNKVRGNASHIAIAAHSMRLAHALLAEREKSFQPVVVAQGKKEVSIIEEPIQEIAPSPQIVAPDGSVARSISPTPPSPLSPQTDLTQIKSLMMGDVA